MEYIYAALLIHKAGKKVDEATLTKVLDAAGVKADHAKVKVVVASLEGVNIDEAIAKAAVVASAPAAHSDGGSSHKASEKKEDKKDDKKAEEASAAGLASLFG
jgi:large subunit ribosomal protein L12